MSLLCKGAPCGEEEADSARIRDPNSETRGASLETPFLFFCAASTPRATTESAGPTTPVPSPDQSAASSPGRGSPAASPPAPARSRTPRPRPATHSWAHPFGPGRDSKVQNSSFFSPSILS